MDSFDSVIWSFNDNDLPSKEMTIIEVPNKTLLFVHVPKTGGISICNSFGLKAQGHEAISRFNPDLMKYYFKFSFVRNPYDRVVSIYNYLKKGGINLHDKLDYMRFCYMYHDFDDFVKRGLYYAKDRQQHFKSMTHYLCIDGKNAMDFMGRFENLQDDYNLMRKMLNLEPMQLPHLNSSSKSINLTIYQKEVIYNIYKEDFQNFNYKK